MRPGGKDWANRAWRAKKPIFTVGRWLGIHGGPTMSAGAGPRLIVGGGRAWLFPKPAPGDTSLNIDPKARPHVVGSIVRAPFGNRQFGTVYFEGVEPRAFTGKNVAALGESARMLKRGGELIIRTGSRHDGSKIVEGLSALGYTNIRVERIRHVIGLRRGEALQIRAKLP